MSALMGLFNCIFTLSWFDNWTANDVANSNIPFIFPDYMQCRLATRLRKWTKCRSSSNFIVYHEFWNLRGFFFRFSLFIFREGKGGRKTLACNPGMRTDWELNLQPLGLQAGSWSTEPHQPGLKSNFFVKGYLAYNIVLISGVKHSDLAA